MLDFLKFAPHYFLLYAVYICKKIIEFYLCIQMLPVNVCCLHFSWTTLYKKLQAIHLMLYKR